jgi:hypothetical protein
MPLTVTRREPPPAPPQPVSMITMNCDIDPEQDKMVITRFYDSVRFEATRTFSGMTRPDCLVSFEMQPDNAAEFGRALIELAERED